jgi:DNA-binding SARP family transcriptional activator
VVRRVRFLEAMTAAMLSGHRRIAPYGMAGGESGSRAHLSFTFWPDTSESNARNNLRQLLHQLRQVLPHPDRYLRTDANSVHWAPDSSFGLDVALFDRAVAAATKAFADWRVDREMPISCHPRRSLT